MGYSCRQLLRLLRMRLCFVWFPFFFSSRCYSYDMKEAQLGLVGGEPVVGRFNFSLLFCLFSLVCCIARCSPRRRARQRCYNRWLFCFLSLYSLVAFALSFHIFHKFFLIFILVPVYTYSSEASF